MKTQFMMLPLVCAVSVAMAAGVEREAPADRKDAAAAPARPPARAQSTHRMKRLPTGDLRHCLELKSNAEIIRCSEAGRQR